jgi:hypothetical protein
MVLLTRPVPLVLSSASPGSPPLEELSGVRALVRSLVAPHAMAYKLLKPTVPPAVVQGPGKAWTPTRLGTMPITFDDTEEPSNVSYLDKHAHPDLRRLLPHRHVRPGADGWGRGDGECGQWHAWPRDSGRHRQ